MKQQLESLKNMLAAAPTWINEVNDAGNETDYIHKWSQAPRHHDDANSRIVIRVLSWEIDFDSGNCLENCEASMLVRLVRDQPADTATGDEEQYEDVVGVLRDLGFDLAQRSFQNIPAFGGTTNWGQIRVAFDEPIQQDVAENPVTDPATAQSKIVWLCLGTISSNQQ